MPGLFDSDYKRVNWVDALAFLAKHPSKSKKLEFLVEARNPCHYNPSFGSCETCESGCNVVLVRRYAESGAFKLLCPDCGNFLKGRLIDVGCSAVGFDIPAPTKIVNQSLPVIVSIVERDRNRCAVPKCGKSPVTVCKIFEAGPESELNLVCLCSECRDADPIWSEPVRRDALLSHTLREMYLRKHGKMPYWDTVHEALNKTLAKWGLENQ